LIQLPNLEKTISITFYNDIHKIKFYLLFTLLSINQTDKYHISQDETQKINFLRGLLPEAGLFINLIKIGSLYKDIILRFKEKICPAVHMFIATLFLS
jgi:hypothetical protein